MFENPYRSVSQRDGYSGSSSWHWSYTILVIGLFVCPFILFYLLPEMLIPIPGIFKFFLLASFFTAIFQYLPFQRTFYMSWIYYIVYNLLGSGVVLGTLMILVSYLSRNDQVETQIYTAYHVTERSEPEADNLYKARVVAFDESKYYLIKTSKTRINNQDQIEITTSKSLFNFKFIKGYHILRNEN